MPRRIADFVIDPILRSSIRTVYLLWKPMAFWTILVYAAFTAMLAPLVVNMVNRGVFRGDRLIVGNEELAAWFLSPSGFFYLFAIALITLTGVLIRFAGLYQIVSDDLKGDPINVKQIALHILQRIHVLVKLCIFSFFGSILILLPLAAGLFVVYSIWLTEFDINYYISVTPPEWTYALWAGGSWAALWALATLGLLAWSLPALPAYLDGRRTIWESLREAWTMPFPRMLRFLKIIAVLAGLWFLLRITTDAVLLFSFSFVADRILADTESLRIIAFFTGSYFLFSFTIAAIISFFGFSLTSTIITKFYYKDSPLNVNIVDPGFLKLAGKTVSFFTWWLTPARVTILAAVLLGGSFAISLVFSGEAPSRERVEIISHRANAGGAPENSIAALENSIAIGADMAEIDVLMTADSVLVILHDADLMRVAGDPRRVADVTYDEISHLRLLTDRTDIPDEKLRIPTLADFLETARGQITLMIELKYYGWVPDLAERTIREIREHNMEDEVVLMSLYLDAVRQVNELAPGIPNGYVSAVAAGDLTRLPVDFFAVNHLNITPGLIRTARDQDRQVYAWTVNRASDMAFAIEKGADGIITDETELAIRVADEMAQLTLAERLLLRFGFLVVDGRSVLMGETDEG